MTNQITPTTNEYYSNEVSKQLGEINPDKNGDPTAKDRTATLRHFDALLAISQLFGALMLILAGYVFGTVAGGFQFNFLPDDAKSNMGNVNLHGLLMTTGLVFIRGEELIIYRLFRHEAKWVPQISHGILHLISLALPIGGFWSIFTHKTLMQHQHFETTHSWLGIGILAGNALHSLIGIYLFLTSKCAPSVKETTLPKQRFFGIGLFITAIGQLMNGVLNYTYYTMGNCFRDKNCPKVLLLLLNLFVLFTVAYATAIILMLWNQQWKRQLDEKLVKRMTEKKEG